MAKEALELKQILTSSSEERSVADVLRDLIQRPDVCVEPEQLFQVSGGSKSPCIAAVYQDGVCYRPFPSKCNNFYLHRNNEMLVYRIIASLRERF